MTDASYTPEPWFVYNDIQIGIPDELPDIFLMITKVEGGHRKENASRIVACVNACRYIPTDKLELAGNVVIPARVTYSVLERQRDELAAQVRIIEERAQELADSGGPVDRIEVSALAEHCRAALAKL